MKNLLPICFLLCGIVNTNSAQTPVAEYNFNNCSGTTLADNIGTLNGTISGATWAEGYNGQALSFDGVDDYVEITGSENDLAFVQNTGVFTIVGWVKINDLSKRSVFFGTSGTTAFKGFGFMYDTYGGQYGDHQLRMTTSIGEAGTVNLALGAKNTINDTNWHHVAVVGDGTSIRFYVDGVQDGTETSIQYFASGPSDHPLTMGQFVNLNGDLTLPYDGRLDQFQIYTTALSSTEITTLAGLASDPANCFDYRESAVEIPHTSDWVSETGAFSTVGLTGDGAPTSCNSESPLANGWFKFQATSAQVTLDLEGITKASLTLWDANYNELVCENDNLTNGYIELGNTNLTIGNWYYVSVDHTATQGVYRGNFTLRIRDDNTYDFIEGAIEIPHTTDWSSAPDAYTTKGMTGDGPVTSCNNLSPFSNVWFKFQATSPQITIDLLGRAKTSMTLWDANLNEITCHTDGQTSGTIELGKTDMVVGDWYYLSVDHTEPQGVYRGPFGLRVRNSNTYNFKEGALEIPHTTDWSSAADAYNTKGMTGDGPAASCNNLSPLSNVWFKFQATSPQITIYLLGRAKTSMTLWDVNLNEISCRTDGQTSGTIELGKTDLVVGDWYYLSVDHTETQALYRGPFGLTVKGASHDAKADAMLLTNTTKWCSEDGQFNNVGATQDGPIPSIYTNLRNNVWFKFQAKTNGIQITIPNSDAQNLSNYVMALFDANNNEVDATRFNMGYQLASNQLIPGEWYYLSVGGSNEASFKLCVNDDIGNDFKEDALILSELVNWCSASEAYDNYHASVDGPKPSVYAHHRPDVWFKFQALQSGVEIELQKGTISGQIIGLFDENDNELDAVRFNGTKVKSTELTIGNWYYLSVARGGSTDSTSTFGLCLNSFIPELRALSDLYNSTGGANWTNNTGWPSTAAEWDAITSIDQVSGWYGVTVVDGDITEVNLNDNSLIGTIPESIGNLKSLTRLSLGKHLTTNQLSGSIPISISELGGLEYLLLSGNQLSGEIPNEIFNILTLKNITISNNQLTGIIPDNIGNALNLTHLSVGGNQLSGEIPASIGNLTNLVHFDAGYQNITGSIPTTIGQLNELRYLSILDASLSGQIPDEIGNCSSLTTIYLQNNNLSGFIPEELGNLSELQTLYLSQNSISGNLPKSFSNLINLTRLNLDRNQLTGTLAIDWSSITNLNTLSVYSNQFTALSVLNNHPNSSGLSVKVHNNHIPQANIDANLNPDGSHNFNYFTYNPQNAIPAEQGDALDAAEITTLRDLYNSTDGANWTDNTGWPATEAEWDVITSIDQVSGWYGVTVANGDITSIQLAANNLIGTIPASLVNLNALELLYLHGNTLTGGIPDLSVLTLKELILSKNNLGGTIPAWITSMTSLEKLILEQCGLTGEIPSDIGNLTNLHTLIFFNNDLTGSLPGSLGNLIKLEKARLQVNKFSGTIPDEIGNLTNLTHLELDRNQLTGSIPASFGNLSNLKTLKLWNNNMSGPLPAALGGMTKLEVFQIHSGNSFSGEIPSNIINLPNLQYFYASHNDFSGVVPAITTNSKLKQVFLGHNTGISQVPDFTLAANMQQLDVKETMVSFAALEENQPIATFTYDPLANPTEFIEHNYIAEQPTTLVNDRSGGANTQYQWQFLNGGVWNDIGETTENLLLDNPAETLNGRSYRCKMTNSAFPGVEIYSSEIKLKREIGQVLDATEIQALRDIYESTDGDNWTDNTGWPSNEAGWNQVKYIDQVVGWYGITVEEGDVIHIDLYNNNLTSSNDLPNSLWTLTGLEVLNIGSNSISSSLPTALSNLSNLSQLTLNNVGLVGSVPAEINSLTQLTHLNLSSNEFAGTFPDLNSLTNLEVLVLQDFESNFGFTEFPYWIQSLTQLKNLSLSNTFINGSLPLWIGDFSELEVLKVDRSKVSGSLPEEIGSLAKLKYLYVNNNELTGSIPASIASLNNLSRLYAYGNDLSQLVSLKELANVGSLKLLVSNNQLTFIELEKNLTGPDAHPFNTFTYAPQNSPANTIKIAAGGDRIIVNDRAGGEHTHYDWQKWNGSAWVSLGAPDESNLQTDGAVYGDKYRCAMTNDWATGVTIYSSTFEVKEELDDVPADFTLQPLYNGNITAMKWRTAQPEGTTDGPYEGIYLFDYDNKYQLTQAVWGLEGATGIETTTNKYRLNNLSYDANGNVQTLKRYDHHSNKIHDFTYKYNIDKSDDTPDITAQQDNQLDKVINNVLGAGIYGDYHYNSVGQLEEEIREDGKNKYVEYDVTGKVTAVYADAAKTQRKVSYTYDDRGFRLSSHNEETGIITWYIRDASGNVMSMYEEDTEESTLAQTEVPVYGSGKVGVYYPQQDGSTAYELTDHLGNVRAVAKRNIVNFTATMEDNGAADYTNPRVEEMQYFENLFETEILNVEDALNHTNTDVVSDPDNAIYLDGSSQRTIGPTVLLKVNGGDKIYSEVFGKYEIANDYLFPAGGLLGSIDDLVLSTSGELTLAQAAAEIEALYAAVIGLETQRKKIMTAGLNIIQFNENFEYVDASFEIINGAGGFEANAGPSSVSWNHLSIDYEAPEDGYVLIYVDNEASGSKVWFDDMSVTLTQKVVTQATDYYPFGMVMRRTNTPNSYFEQANNDKQSLEEAQGLHLAFNRSLEDRSSNSNMVIGDNITYETGVDGEAENAVAIDGTGAIEIADAPAVEFGGNDFTVTFWLKNLDGVGGNKEMLTLFKAGVIQGTNLAFVVNQVPGSEGEIVPEQQSNTGSMTPTTGSPATFLFNYNYDSFLAWTHVAMMRRGDTFELYINGNKTAELPFETGFAFNDTDSPILVARQNVDSYATGLDEMHIFTKSMTVSELNMLMQQQKVKDIDAVTARAQQIAFGQYYNYGYQGQFAMEDAETGWNSFELRMYDAVIGRWLVTDPFRQYPSPYVSFGNDPINRVDPNGGTDGCPNCDKDAMIGEVVITGSRMSFMEKQRYDRAQRGLSFGMDWLFRTSPDNSHFYETQWKREFDTFAGAGANAISMTLAAPVVGTMLGDATLGVATGIEAVAPTVIIVANNLNALATFSYIKLNGVAVSSLGAVSVTLGNLGFRAVRSGTINTLYARHPFLRSAIRSFQSEVLKYRMGTNRLLMRQSEPFIPLDPTGPPSWSILNTLWKSTPE